VKRDYGHPLLAIETTQKAPPDNITESDHGKAILIALNINFFDARERKIINFKLVRRIKKVVKITFRERGTKRVQLDGSRRA